MYNPSHLCFRHKEDRKSSIHNVPTCAVFTRNRKVFCLSYLSIKDLVVRSYTEYDNTRYLVMPTARDFFSSLQSQKTTSLQDFWSFYHNPQSPVNKVKLARIRDAPDAEVNATEKIFQSWMRKKARMFSNQANKNFTKFRHVDLGVEETRPKQLARCHAVHSNV